MKVQLVDVDETNWRACAELKMTEEETSFVNSNALTISEWKFEPENIVKAIYSDSVLIGMLAYYFHDGDYGVSQRAIQSPLEQPIQILASSHRRKHG